MLKTLLLLLITNSILASEVTTEKTKHERCYDYEIAAYNGSRKKTLGESLFSGSACYKWLDRNQTFQIASCNMDPKIADLFAKNYCKKP